MGPTQGGASKNLYGYFGVCIISYQLHLAYYNQIVLKHFYCFFGTISSIVLKFLGNFEVICA